MKAIILCGGKGTRLHPFTENLPKPLVPFGGEPLLFRIIRQLINSNIHDIMLTLGHRKDQIRKTVENEHFSNCTIYFSEEKAPLGTAGCILQCKEFISEETLIISGDCVFDGDYNDFIANFQKQTALVSIGASVQTDPTEFGCILLDSESNVQGFLEKPSWEQVRTDLVSTGIYLIKPEIIQLIASLEKENCDFAKDVFPEMLRRNKKIHVYTFQNYWCDVGTPEAYLNAATFLKQTDTLGSVYWEGVEVGTNSFVRKSVLGKNVKVGNNVIIQNAFIGSNTVIEDDVCIVNAKIDDGMTLAKGTSVSGILRRTGETTLYGNIAGDTELVGALSYDFLSKLARCISLFFDDTSTIAVVSKGGNQADANTTFIHAGLLAYGREVRLGHGISLPALRWMIRNGLCDGGVYITNNRIRLLNEKGNDLNRAQRRKLNGIYQKNESLLLSKQFYGTDAIQNPEEFYYTELIRRFPCPYRSLDYWGKNYTQEERNAYIAQIVLEFYPDAPIFMEQHHGLLAEKLAKEYDRYIVYCGSKIGDVQEEMEHFMHIPGVYEQYLMYTDDFALDLAASMYRANRKDFGLADSMKVYTQEQPIACKKNQCASLLRRLNQELYFDGNTQEDGLTLRGENECVHIQADDNTGGVRLYVESFNEETSRELMVHWENQIHDLTKTLR